MTDMIHHVCFEPSTRIQFHINRVDVFGNDAYSTNFCQWNTGYWGEVGLVDANSPVSENDEISNMEGNLMHFSSGMHDYLG